jgi:hypothetical protein
VIKVTIKRNGETIVRVAQIVGDAPGPGNVWAYTCDDMPREALKLRRWTDKVTGRTSYVEAPA